MDSLHTLINYFSEFPGIGPRQARRFVYYLLSKDASYLKSLIGEIEKLKQSVRICESCFRFFEQRNKSETRCSICRDQTRDHSIVMVVGRDSDLENIERTGTFSGVYFVLGGLIPILEKNPEERVRMRELKRMVETRAANGELKELIFALSATPEGDNTAQTLEETLSPLAGSITISHLGKGISTGTELEYSDAETLKNALKNRQ